MTLQESALNDVAVHTLIENMGRPQGTFTATGQGVDTQIAVGYVD